MIATHDINYFITMPAMRYYDNKDENNLKRQAMIENENNEYMASVKHDGCWACLIHFSKGHNLIRSRSISKVTGTYGDYTEKLPHIVAEMDDHWPDNTVMLAEIAFDKPKTTANSVGTILRCLPEKAVMRQSKEKLSAFVFDLLMLDGKDMMSEGYWNRSRIMIDYLKGNHGYQYIQPTEYIFENFAVAASRVISEGGEGVVIQRRDNPYMPDTRAAWKTLKLKKQLDELELLVIATIEPNEHYDGDCPEAWKYWYHDMPNANKEKPNYPVTKPFFYGWKNGVVVNFNGVNVRVTSGLSDEARQWLATKETQELIEKKELYVIIQAMDINSQNSLRHPYIKEFRLASDGAAE